MFGLIIVNDPYNSSLLFHNENNFQSSFQRVRQNQSFYNSILELLCFLSWKIPPFVCFCLKLAIIFRSLSPLPRPPLSLSYHNWCQPHPPPCHNVSYLGVTPLHDVIYEWALNWQLNARLSRTWKILKLKLSIGKNSNIT